MCVCVFKMLCDGISSHFLHFIYIQMFYFITSSIGGDAVDLVAVDLVVVAVVVVASALKSDELKPYVKLV